MEALALQLLFSEEPSTIRINRDNPRTIIVNEKTILGTDGLACQKGFNGIICNNGSVIKINKKENLDDL